MQEINRLYLLPDGSWRASLRNKQGVLEGKVGRPEHQDYVEVWTQLFNERFGRFYTVISRSHVNREMVQHEGIGLKVLAEEEIVRLRNLKRPPDFEVPQAANIVDLVGVDTWRKLGREPRQQGHDQPHTFSTEREISASDAHRIIDLLEQESFC